MIISTGSVRMFDLRHLEHSTIIYEDPQHTPLLRLAWNKQDPNYLATVAMDACEVIILVNSICTPRCANEQRLPTCFTRGPKSISWKLSGPKYWLKVPRHVKNTAISTLFSLLICLGNLQSQKGYLKVLANIKWPMGPTLTTFAIIV